MNVLILGSGGREHAFAYSISKSSLLSQLFVAPGNAGTAQIATNVALGVTDFQAIKEFVLENNVQMVVVGPEAPLVEGIYDYFQEDAALKDVNVIGPSKQAAMLEGSKEFAKEFMERNEVPTAAYKSFTATSLKEGMAFIDSLKPPFVLKADGLAGGKGVLIISDAQEAKESLEEMLVGGKFGAASNKVVIEEFLDGIEMSVFVLTDGDSYKILPTAKDYKRIGEGDTGLNTGGMGAVSPVPFADDVLMQKIEQKVVIPTVEGFKKENLVYKGFVFIGLMIVDQEPLVIEYNVRMGDPETESVLPRISSDLLSHLNAFATTSLDQENLVIDERSATTVMCVAGGYPEAYDKGMEITGLDEVVDSIVFHAGTTVKDGKIVTNGGRVMTVTSYGTDFNEALKKSYQNVDKLHFDRMYYRTDIGFDL
ncbi:phosphoribosylamine--glycine ligase [Nonlabens ulvanivorans]|uniref:Phosphoribosylamine--glycine ligase n=1 Tax=Nonlabens ulvanivorans TaxID=906888 RepID=A0A084JTX6_NONUL|nr:phosphoribosylamine--glycine ligase [Nonlabens ulvanivorans]KEZ92410.1 phosphoribosylamine--glycine ligase [Nonlabens ulvanivorans]PRX15246.1 phosphoribosylamine--glycine ligase [Nonlabens ulvanivorans]